MDLRCSKLQAVCFFPSSSVVRRLDAGAISVQVNRTMGSKEKAALFGVSIIFRAVCERRRLEKNISNGVVHGVVGDTHTSQLEASNWQHSTAYLRHDNSST